MFNFTCLEFLGSGTPVICSDGAGCSDLIIHGKNGLKYMATDTAALAECIRKIDQMGQEEYNNMALAGLETIKNQLSASKLIAYNLEEYKSVITDFKTKPSNPFLDSIYNPSEKEYDLKDILDRLPLKRLMNYVLKRIKGKMGTNIL
jgi:hypothetical protein